MFMFTLRLKMCVRSFLCFLLLRSCYADMLHDKDRVSFICTKHFTIALFFRSGFNPFFFIFFLNAHNSVQTRSPFLICSKPSLISSLTLYKLCFLSIRMRSITRASEQQLAEWRLEASESWFWISAQERGFSPWWPLLQEPTTATP